MSGLSATPNYCDSQPKSHAELSKVAAQISTLINEIFTLIESDKYYDVEAAAKLFRKNFYKLHHHILDVVIPHEIDMMSGRKIEIQYLENIKQVITELAEQVMSQSYNLALIATLPIHKPFTLKDFLLPRTTIHYRKAIAKRHMVSVFNSYGCYMYSYLPRVKQVVIQPQ